MSESESDLPKTVAVIMVAIPSLVLRTGFAYLQTRKRARKNAKMIMKGMIQSGIPPELAKRLADEYVDQLSIKTILRGFGPGSLGGRPVRPQ